MTEAFEAEVLVRKDEPALSDAMIWLAVAIRDAEAGRKTLALNTAMFMLDRLDPAAPIEYGTLHLWSALDAVVSAALGNPEGIPQALDMAGRPAGEVEA